MTGKKARKYLDSNARYFKGLTWTGPCFWRFKGQGLYKKLSTSG